MFAAIYGFTAMREKRVRPIADYRQPVAGHDRNPGQLPVSYRSDRQIAAQSHGSSLIAPQPFEGIIHPSRRQRRSDILAYTRALVKNFFIYFEKIFQKVFGATRKSFQR